METIANKFIAGEYRNKNDVGGNLSKLESTEDPGARALGHVYILLYVDMSSSTITPKFPAVIWLCAGTVPKSINSNMFSFSCMLCFYL